MKRFFLDCRQKWGDWSGRANSSTKHPWEDVVAWMRMSPIIMCLNTWSPVGGAVWVGSGGVGLLEEVCHGGGVGKGGVWGFKATYHSQFTRSGPAWGSRRVMLASAAIAMSGACCLATLWNHQPYKPSLYMRLWSQCFKCSNGKIIDTEDDVKPEEKRRNL